MYILLEQLREGVYDGVCRCYCQCCNRNPVLSPLAVVDFLEKVKDKKKKKNQKREELKMRMVGEKTSNRKVKILNCYFLQLHVQRARELLLFLRDYVR